MGLVTPSEWQGPIGPSLHHHFRSAVSFHLWWVPLTSSSNFIWFGLNIGYPKSKIRGFIISPVAIFWSTSPSYRCPSFQRSPQRYTEPFPSPASNGKIAGFGQTRTPALLWLCGSLGMAHPSANPPTPIPT